MDMLIDIDHVRRRQDEIRTEVDGLRAAPRVSETTARQTRLEELKALDDFLRRLSLVHARLDRGEPENLAELADYRPPDSERLYIFSGDPRPFLSWRAVLEVRLVAGPSVEGKLPALYYLYSAPQGAFGRHGRCPLPATRLPGGRRGQGQAPRRFQPGSCCAHFVSIRSGSAAQRLCFAAFPSGCPSSPRPSG